MNRRSFLSSAAGLGGAALIGMGCASEEVQSEGEPMPMRTLPAVGLQLYTLASAMESDFEGTIRKVAAVGYAEAEFAGYFERDPSDVRALLDDVGLTAPAAHISIEMLKADLSGVLVAAKTIGHRYIVCPYLAEDQRSILQYRDHARFFNEVGMACQEAGMQFAYHNHDFEFFETDGIIPYDLLLAETDPQLVMMELDLYWIKKGGQDALRYFAAHAGRFPLCHVKDMAEDGSITTVGAGTIDFAPIFAQSEQAGLLHFFVEHDRPDDPMGTITKGYAHLSALKF